MWRPDDEALLDRLRHEELLDRVFRHHVGPIADRVKLHPRAAGLVAAAIALPGGEDVAKKAEAGDVAALVRFLEAPPMTARPPALLHHLALYFAKVATALESIAPDAAANAWTRSLAAWIALGEERAYLVDLEDAILKGGDGKMPKGDIAIPPEKVPLEILADLGERATEAARDLAPSGRAALLALTWIGDAARTLGGASDATSLRIQHAAERRRNAALDAALAAVGEALDEANVRGDLTKEARAILVRVIEIWTWSGNDEAAEQFAMDKIALVGWELYRARRWDELRHLLDPFRALIEHQAMRIERDRSKVAYAAPCAQMFVFLSDVEPYPVRKRELAERSISLCPTHRNGRLVLAALLCEEATKAMNGMVLFARKSDLERVEAIVARAEQLYPTSSDLPATKDMLERVKKGRIAL